MTEAAAILVMGILGTYYFRRKKTYKVRALICKASATAFPALLLLRCFPVFMAGPQTGQNTGGVSLTAAAWTLAGILCYMAADVLLECRFAAGAAAFSIGHLCMGAGFLAGGAVLYDGVSRTAAWFSLTRAAVPLILFIALAYAVLKRYFDKLRAKNLFLPALFYIFILSLNASLAVAEGIQEGLPRGIIPAAGGICFVISDILLGLNRLGKKRSLKRGAAVLILYYASVYLFSMRFWITLY